MNRISSKIRIVSAVALGCLIYVMSGRGHTVSVPFKSVPPKDVPALLSANESQNSTTKPTLIYVSADWCLECPRFESSVLSNSRLTSQLNRFELLRVDATENPGVWPELSRVGVQSVPALIVKTDSGLRAISAHSDFPIEAIASLLEHS